MWEEAGGRVWSAKRGTARPIVRGTERVHSGKEGEGGEQGWCGVSKIDGERRKATRGMQMCGAPEDKGFAATNRRARRTALPGGRTSPRGGRPGCVGGGAKRGARQRAAERWIVATRAARCRWYRQGKGTIHAAQRGPLEWARPQGVCRRVSRRARGEKGRRGASGRAPRRGIRRAALVRTWPDAASRGSSGRSPSAEPGAGLAKGRG